MTEILLYGEVGWDFDALWLNERLEGAEGDVTLRVHSPGGDVFDGVAIANSIRRARARGRRVTAVVDGLAASAASYMCLTCDEVLAGPGTVFMIHPPSGGCWGTAEDMRETAQALDTCHESICDLYEMRSGRPRRMLDDAMRRSTWMTADEAVSLGIADGIDAAAAPDLAAVDAKWASASRSYELAAYADEMARRGMPELRDRMDSIRSHSRGYEKSLLEARAVGNPPADNSVPTLASTADGDGGAEAAPAGEGEAPAYALANGHVYRIGSKE